MDYHKSAEELLATMLRSEQCGRLIPTNISEFARGELAVLIFLTDGNNGASAHEISRRFQINTSRVAAILNSLCGKGFVKREPHPEDRRKIQVYFTEKGQRFAEHRRREILERMCAFLRILGEEDAREHIRIMKRISEIMKSAQ